MGTELHYKPGSFYRICDRTGFATRAERTRMEWNGLIVRDRVWEARQPQDFVRGVDDNQTVPYARPRPVNTFVVNRSPQFLVSPDPSSRTDCIIVQSGQFAVYGIAQAVTPDSL